MTVCPSVPESRSKTNNTRNGMYPMPQHEIAIGIYALGSLWKALCSDREPFRSEAVQTAHVSLHRMVSLWNSVPEGFISVD